MNILLRCLAVAAVACGFSAGAHAAEANKYPVRPIRFIVPFPPGGGADIIARAIGQKLTASLGEQVVIDNRPGAAGVLGAALAAQATPDGYHILLASSNLAILEGGGTTRRPYDLRKDLKSVIRVAVAPNMLVVNPAVPARSVRELIAHAKASPGKLQYASNGIGSSSHLSAELFESMAGVDMGHVPYKGGPPGVAATVGGEVQLVFSAILHVWPHAKAGRLRALAVTGKARSKVAPQVPTVAESALPGYESTQWWIVMVPARVPDALVKRLNVALADALTAADLRERLSNQGAETVVSTPEEARQFLLSEIEKWAKVVRTAGIKLQ